MSGIVCQLPLPPKPPRRVAVVCQDCWAAIRPGDYLPDTFGDREGRCVACAQWSSLFRVSWAEVEAYWAVVNNREDPSVDYAGSEGETE